MVDLKPECVNFTTQFFLGAIAILPVFYMYYGIHALYSPIAPVPISVPGFFMSIFWVTLVGDLIGAYGFKCGPRWLFYILAGFMVIVILLEIISGAIIISTDINKKIEKQITEWFHENGTEILEIQTRLECCGLNGQRDWLEKEMEVPDSCCHNQRCNVFVKSVWAQGCIEAAQDHYYPISDSTIMTIVTLSYPIFQIIATSFLIYVMRKDLLPPLQS